MRRGADEQGRPMKLRRLLLLAIGCLVLSGFVARLWMLQVERREEFRRLAGQQQLRTVELAPPRGTLFDARGRKLAVSLNVESVYATPAEVEDPTAAAAALAPLTGQRRSLLEGRLAENRPFVWVARQLDPPVAERVRQLDLPGVSFVREYRRYYPQIETAGQVIGFAGRDHTGLEGLEQGYEDVMAGAAARRLVMRDANAGIVLSPRLSLAEAEPGKDVHLTLDSHIQYLLQRELEAAVDRHQASRAMGVILDPMSGAVLAMATVPSFDPNSFQESSNEVWKNRTVTDAFEPGSTFKIVTAAAALEANLFDPSDTIDCEMGGITLDGVRINDHKPFDLLTFREVIAKSSNVGTIKVGLRVGRKALYEQIGLFGFGRHTGVDLPGEERGLVRPLDSWYLRDPAYISFGQGVSVTALQLTNAFAVVANGGTLYRPYIVAGVGPDAESEAVAHRPEVMGSPIGAATARTLERMLEAVVEEGTGQAAAVPGYRVAGKTGTAQKPVPGGYSPDKHLASFAGFAPARNPAFVALITVDEPVGLFHGGEVAAPVFAAVAREILSYLGVPPDLPVARPEEPTSPRLLAERRPPPPAAVDGTMPDLRGRSARQALTLAANAGLEPDLYGSGFVARQSPPPGTALADASESVELWLGTASGAEAAAE
jgi:cell division protein FtsI (penicillin-binding protein 3)